MRKIDRTGEIKFNTQGLKMQICKYKNCCDIYVKFENGYIKHTNYDAFLKGEVFNSYHPNLFGVGYLGNTKSTIKGKNKKSYITWKNILARCYDKTSDSYKYYGGNGCSVCKEWLCFENFEKWYNENYYECSIGGRMCVDKDILVKGNKIYSPQTCVIVPNLINDIFTKSNANRGSLPIGVSFDKKAYGNPLNMYGARMSQYNFNTQKKELLFIGYFDNAMEAFYEYKYQKEQYIKDIADLYKNEIPEKLYKAMYNYEVELTD